jgi:thioredoxin-related protein
MTPMFPARSLLPVLLPLSLAATPAIADAADETITPGKVTGAKQGEHPDWFKESFLDITEDVDEAADEDRHVILFLEMNGCPYCAKMLKENFAEAPYRDFIQENFDVIAMNIRGDREVAFDAETTATEKQLAEMLDVRFTPTVIFLNQDNRPVARINGYRNIADFKQVLDFVAGAAYQEQDLASWLDAAKAASDSDYQLRPDPRIVEIADLSSVDGPLALLFEDRACVACDDLHDGHLADPEVRKALEPFTLVRIDTLSDAPITAPDGTKTTQQALTDQLGVQYRPTLVLFDRGKEIARIESMLYRYHFTGLLEYVGQGHYQEYPDSPFDYINAKTARLLAAGKDIAVSEDSD